MSDDLYVELLSARGRIAELERDKARLYTREQVLKLMQLVIDEASVHTTYLPDLLIVFDAAMEEEK